MDLLNLLTILRNLAKARGEFRTDGRSEAILTLPIREGCNHAHFILDTRLSREILRDAETFSQDRFLDAVLPQCDPARSQWIRFFVSHSPEFLDGEPHAQVRRNLFRELDHYNSHAAMVSASELAERVSACRATGSAISSLDLARLIVTHFFERMLSARLQKAITLEDPHLLFGDDIFTPSLRSIMVLQGINDVVDAFLRAHASPQILADDTALLGILTLLLMGAPPISSAICCLFNHLCQHGQEEARQLDLSAFTSYAMTPTSWVSRNCTRRLRVGTTTMEPEDKVYVFLFPHSGCPFTRLTTIPFGQGRHQCPGTAISATVMHRTTEFAQLHLGALGLQLIPSPVNRGLPTTFLRHGEGAA